MEPAKAALGSRIQIRRDSVLGRELYISKEKFLGWRARGRAAEKLGGFEVSQNKRPPAAVRLAWL